MNSQNISYNEKIDHLRFFAALMVLMFHTEWLTPQRLTSWIPVFHDGHAGVQLFMVISGFILTLIVHEREINIPGFYRNRILRIYPLFIFVVSLGYFLSVEHQASKGLEYLLALLPISNMYRNSYGAFGGTLWSVAVELQFYLLFPFLITAIQRYGEKFGYLLIAMMLVLRAAVFAHTGSAHHFSYFTIFGAMDSFVMGIIAARFHLRNRFELNVWTPIAILAITNVIIAILFTGNFFHVDYANGAPFSNSRLWIVWPTIAAALFALLTVTYLKSNHRLPFSPVIAAFGKWSYSSYVWHWMIIVAVMRLVGSYGLHPYFVGAFLVLPLTIAWSAMSYYLIERPFLDKRMRYIDR